MHIKTEIQDSVLTWQINRPDRRNALGPILAQELLKNVATLTQNLPSLRGTDNEPRLLVIKATPVEASTQPIWIAGGDLKELAELADSADGRKYAETMSDVCQGLQALPLPVVAVLDGLVIGGGIEFALAADIRFATARTTFHFKQLELGLSTAYASAGRLADIVGSSKAFYWLLRSQTLSAAECEASGLIHHIFATIDELETELETLKIDIKRLNPNSIKAQKHFFNLHTKNNHIEAELDVFQNLWMNDYHKNSLKNFLKANPKANQKDSKE